MELNGKIWLAKSDEKVFLEPKMANRHGFIAGASGTGKTITLKVLAESFSQLGVPVFLADIKGDLAGMCKAGLLPRVSNAVLGYIRRIRPPRKDNPKRNGADAFEQADGPERRAERRIEPCVQNCGR